ncbi:uncharacterized protein PV06_01317 [Exophiala oligosperma]|uniref:Uncharacterized protein n=1 Tax=Exophiala oligosperma TaxID=215243 RepID=A0A0D2B963_9EURO|nr:uncharacterized protein PV06_01317 [Exophiala oligosperma]KIW48751.1 hypothetical protein PV06_01317 [Exophiala oligosperma]
MYVEHRSDVHLIPPLDGLVKSARQWVATATNDVVVMEHASSHDVSDAYADATSPYPHPRGSTTAKESNDKGGHGESDAAVRVQNSEVDTDHDQIQ